MAEQELASEQPVDDGFEQLLDYIKSNRGFDFTGYKRPSLRRRIGKRMDEAGCVTFPDYQARLAADQNEFVQLFNTILINVTAFFRDPAAWDFLRSSVLPTIAADRGAADEIRVWTPGCASGQEAYTLAMLLAEELGEDRFRQAVKIYATDVDEEALAHGRHGRYAGADLDGVTADLRERYFELRDGAYVFRADLRRSVIFGRHDLIQDPPISRIDLLVARNTLMYFVPEIQGRILTNFHFSLRDSGYLFLGKSEVPLTRSNLFVPVDLRNRVFAKARRSVTVADRLVPVVPDGRPDGTIAGDDNRTRASAFESVPVAQLVVDVRGTLTLANVMARALFGLTQKDLGLPLQDLELSYRPVELRSLIERARAERHQVTLRDVEWRSASGDTRYFDVQVAPLSATDGAPVGTGITFIDVSRYRRLQESLEVSKSKLETAFEELQSTAEELETTNEELQSTNEELETTNEELQSTNEELETMNEELQSTNEELETINDELRDRTHDLHEVNAYLESILVSIDAGVAVVDEDMHVTAWNAQAFDLWGVRADEVSGRHLADLDIGLPVNDLVPMIRSVFADDEAPKQVVVPARTRRGHEIECRVRLSRLLAPDGSARGTIVLMEQIDDA